MVTFLNDDLSPEEWNRRRTQQASGGGLNGGLDTGAPLLELHDGLSPAEWQKVRGQQANGVASATPPQPDPKRAAARDYGAHHIMDLIPKGEGTSSYDATYRNGDGRGAYYPKDRKRPTELTIDEAIAMAPEARRVAGDYAIGFYQFKPAALQDAKRRLNLTGSELLTPAMQDRIARDRLAYRGYDSYLSGAMTPEQFQRNLALEWPSLAGQPGVEQFDGVRRREPRVSAADVRATMDRAWDEADRITDSYIDAGQMPPARGRWREPSQPARSPRR